jgi:hypothetical protein
VVGTKRQGGRRKARRSAGRLAAIARRWWV